MLDAGAPTNGDRIAQNNESDRATTPVRRRADPAPGPDIRRTYNIEYSAGIDRELFPGVAVSGSWYRRSWHNLATQINTLVNYADYSRSRPPIH